MRAAAQNLSLGSLLAYSVSLVLSRSHSNCLQRPRKKQLYFSYFSQSHPSELQVQYMEWDQKMPFLTSSQALLLLLFFRRQGRREVLKRKIQQKQQAVFTGYLLRAWHHARPGDPREEPQLWACITGQPGDETHRQTVTFC